MIKKILDRRIMIILLISLLFAGLMLRLANLTIINGDHYEERALNNRIKEISLVAKRGEILDRNGQVLAGNETAFMVEFSPERLSPGVFNQVAIRLLSLLEDQEEEGLSFPIQYEGGAFYYTYDEEVLDWLGGYGYEGYTPAREVFDDIRRAHLISDELDDYAAQEFLLLKGVKLPISVRRMEYLSELEKTKFLESFHLDTTLTAQEAYEAIRGFSRYQIGEEVSIEDSLKILAMRYGEQLKGYYKYQPITIASDVKKETAILIQELGMDLPGVNISVAPIRYYPFGDLAAHVLGYLGKISSEAEIEKYVEGLGYNRSDIIGKIGIEGVFETVLNGTNGRRYVEVDAYGRLVRELEETYDSLTSEEPIAGKNIKLTIDKDLQEQVEFYLEKGIKHIQTGTTYESPWGNTQYKPYPKAETGAAVVVDVNTGEILAMASYPDYDLNLFATGISNEDWESLSPENPRNPLAPRPLYNIAALTAVQPGSTYKMMTGIAALEQGLDPNMKLYSDGFIEIGSNDFGCWYWNTYRGKHGLTDYYRALETSCNYYFFDVVRGYDYYKNKKLPFEMNAFLLTEYSKKFGFNEPTGVEIGEVSKGVPTESKKKYLQLWGLEIKLHDVFTTYFPSFLDQDEDKKKEIIEEILILAEDFIALETVSEQVAFRYPLIKRLEELGADKEVEELADLIVFSYFRLMKWTEGDNLNLSIGQGDHQYTPLQMARYVMAIANDGYLHDLTLVKEIGGVAKTDNRSTQRIMPEESTALADSRLGMYLVAHGASGTAKSYFRDFPISVGAKTGSAQKEGKIPPGDEIAYLWEFLPTYAESIYTYEDAYRTPSNSESWEEVNFLAGEYGIRPQDFTYDYLMEEVLTEEKIKKGIEDQLYLRNEELARIEDKERAQEKILGGYLNEEVIMRDVIKGLVYDRLSDTDINQYRDDYDAYAWFVSFAPYDNPEIAIVVFIPQGGSGGYGSAIAKDIYGYYFGLEGKE